MSYYFSKIVTYDFDTAIEKTTEALKTEGFGVLTEIDVKATLKKKLDVDFRKYRILGACNPQYAYKAFMTEDKIGTMLPCNFVVQELDDGRVEVACIDPVASMRSIENQELSNVATVIGAKLQNVLNQL